MKTAFVFCLLLKRKWYGNVNYSNIAVGICILIDSIDKYSKWYLWMLHHKKIIWCMPSEKPQQSGILSTTVLQQNTKPHWPGDARVLASVSVGWCVSVQEVHSICLQHDLLNLTYLSTASGRDAPWMKDGLWWVKLWLCHCFLSCVDKVLYEKRRDFVILQNVIWFNFPDLKNWHQVSKAADPWKNTVEGTHLLSM